ncbi:MAG: outer membrane beta-barrel protein [Chitinophagaceae bacterium]|nr:outer membrane beta-barrel protein [Chitinophagaceae bacterium]
MRIIFTLLILAVVSTSYGQTITGSVRDRSDRSPVAGSTIFLQSRTDSTNTKFLVTDSVGAFRISVFPGLYKLQISAVGYISLDTLLVAGESVTDLGTISLLKNEGLLGEVVVKGTLPPVKQKGDTLEYNSSAFKVNPDANAEDMVKKMPGITIEQGVVKAHGENVRKVTVDGRDFFGEDATATLKNLPAEIIDKIQVFDRLSEQAQLTGFEDDNTAKGINIVTKANMRNGQFGRVFAGYGTDNRYSAGGNVSFFNGDRRISLVGMTNNINAQNFATEDLLGVTSSGGGGQRRGGGGGGRGRQGGGGGGGGNFRSSGQGNFLVGQQSGISKTNSLGINFSDKWGDKLDVSGSYFFNNSNNTANEITNRQYFLENDSTQLYNENQLSSSSNYNHRVNMRLQYKIDSSNTLIITPNISFQKNNSINHVIGVNSALKGIISETENLNTSNNSGFNINNNILYRHAFAKRGRSLSLNLGTSVNRRSGESFINAFNTSDNIEDSLQQFTDRLTNGYQLNANISYTEPVGKTGMLQFSYRPSYSVNHADQGTFQYDGFAGKYNVFDTSLSNKFDNEYITQNGGVNYRINNKKNSFSVGLSYQRADLSSEQEFPVKTTTERSFSNLLPTAMWNSKLSAKSSIRISYRSNTSAPSINQLQNVINNNNPLILSTGNPNLDQQYSHNIIARYTYTNTAKGLSFFGNMFFQKTNDYIGNATFLAASDSVLSNSVVLYKGSQLVKPVNLDGYWNLRSFLTLGMPLKFIRSNLNFNAGYSYSNIPGIVNGVSNVSAAQTYNTGAVLASNISENVDFTLSYSANFNRVRNSIQPSLNNNYFTQNAGVQMNLISNNGWVFQNDLNNQSYRGLTDGFNQNFWLWNMGVGKKFLKNNNGELRLTVFDLLKQNRSIARNVEEIYVEDVQTQVLKQYFMLTFSYRLRNFGSRK